MVVGFPAPVLLVANGHVADGYTEVQSRSYPRGSFGGGARPGAVFAGSIIRCKCQIYSGWNDKLVYDISEVVI